MTDKEEVREKRNKNGKEMRDKEMKKRGKEKLRGNDGREGI